MITFLEAPGFTARLRGYLDDAEYAALQWALCLRPDAGALIPGCGGLRWRGKERGKSGGYRVIYYWRTNAGEIWMLTVYAKSEEQNIPAHVLRRIKEEFER